LTAQSKVKYLKPEGLSALLNVIFIVELAKNPYYIAFIKIKYLIKIIIYQCFKN